MPDTVLIDKKNQDTIIIDVAISGDVCEKTSKYQYLALGIF